MTFDEWVKSKNNSYINRTVSTFRWNSKRIKSIDDFFMLDERQKWEIQQVRRAYADIMNLYMQEQNIGKYGQERFAQEYECIWGEDKK